MKNTKFIPITDVSNYYHIEISILKDFAEGELINIRIKDQIECVLSEDLEQIKRIIDLYKGLGVNKEGIEIILSMRDQILAMDEEMTILKLKLDYRRTEYRYRFVELPNQRGLLIDYEE
ncbi:MAG: hypothetical protein PF518_13110 [Spirochaetaceae bacterium]|jgi:phosphoglycerate-specific signal transduction histidine kinase|nr:hypothetical protein [Spirochaetaceae bacterium]